LLNLPQVVSVTKGIRL